MSMSDAKAALVAFVKTFGAGIIAFALLVLASMPVSAEQVFAVALVIALDNYLKSKGIYTTALKTVGLKK